MRRIALHAHRLVGLSVALFLVSAGLTGSVLAFSHELDGLLNSHLKSAPPPEARPLEPVAMRESLLRHLPSGSAVNMVPLDVHAGEAATFFATIPKEAHAAPDDQFFVDPYTGQVVGSRHYGDLSQGIKNLVPFVYRLHADLALGAVGSYLLGIVALLWTLDCFVGAYLTLPPRLKASKGKHVHRGWIRRWMPAWIIRTNKLFAFVFTWHRASGLWLWSMLLLFAWSAVAMNLRPVYDPLMRLVFETDSKAYELLPAHKPPRQHPGLSWTEAHKVGRALMAEQTAQRGVQVLSERRLSYEPMRGAFFYQVRSTLDVAGRFPTTTVWFDGDTADLLLFEGPRGQQRGHTITSWLYAFHLADLAAAGVAYRIFVCILGIAVCSLSVTGIWIWWRMRTKRSQSSRPTYIQESA